jgi:lipid-binding SYLF domain-containing protein
MNTKLALVVLSMLVALSAGCATAPSSQDRRDRLEQSAEQGLREMRNADPSMDEFLRGAFGYAMFPSVGSGGLGIGAGWGRAVVVEGERLVGFADMTQANIGLTAGGQRFRQLIVFQNQAALDRFRGNQLSLDANFAAVALTTGAAASANYTNGVAVFVQPIGGLMVSANVGGQQFRFQPVD